MMDHRNGKNPGHHLVKEAEVRDYHILDPNLPFYEDFRAVPPDKYWIPLFAGWVPLYTLGFGSLCLVFQKDGTRSYFGTSSRWVFDKVTTFYDINYSSMRQKFYICTGRYQSIALPIYQRDTFMFAVKGRHTKGPGSGRNDGAFGYLVNTCVEEVRPLGSRHVRVSLAGNQQVDLHMGLGSFEKQRKDGHHFHLCMMERDRV